jgi:futalosine hydrolase
VILDCFIILMKTDLLILCATLPEVNSFLSVFPPDSKRMFKGGAFLFSGKKGDQSYDLLISGPGVFNTAYALTVYLEHLSCSMILQTGIAGVFKQSGLCVGDMAVASGEQYIHTGVRTDLIMNKPLPFDLIDSVVSTREGRYVFDPETVNRFYDHLHSYFADGHTQVAKGAFITVSAISGSQEVASQLYSAFSPVMENMEGAAAAHIAALYKIPLIEIRAASNFVGERDKTKWDIDKAVKGIAGFLVSARL